MAPKYIRTVDELRQVASMFWPEDLSRQAAELSIIPKLIETQDQFLAILNVKVRDIEGVFQILRSSELPANLFLKHLVILADVGGEALKRITGQFDLVFPNHRLDYVWYEETRTYSFKSLPAGIIGNQELRIQGRDLFEPHDLTPLYEDIIAILLLGSSVIYADDQRIVSVLAKCEIGSYLGKPDELEKFVKQRYMWVSRITVGAEANNLGQVTQKFVATYLKEHLDIAGIMIQSNGHIPGVTHTSEDDARLITFDLVVSKPGRYVAIEVSFQVTTNSTIERKSGQAQSRYEQIERQGYKIAYVIDGAGNFERESALRTICTYTHCAVALSAPELNLLCQFLTDYFVTG